MSQKFGGGVNYLAIGNSITRHGVCDYWWIECGMAATEPSKDYFHLVIDEIKKQNNSVVSCTFNFGVWEMLATDRAQTRIMLDPYLNPNINLITIQLGENASDLTNFETDFEFLINHVKKQCPKAQIIIVSDFWEFNGRDQMKINAAKKCDVKIADIRAIKNNRKYQSSLGTKVFGADGEKHVIEHNGVAAHPGDEGMKYIAEKIIEQVIFY